MVVMEGNYKVDCKELCVIIYVSLTQYYLAILLNNTGIG